MKEGKFVVLCVDDDPDMLSALAMVLERSGYLVRTAASGEEGFREFREAAPDLVIVDLMMEQVDSGTRLLARLKEAGNRAPVYVLSSIGDALQQTVSTADLGLAGVFQKPIDPRSLVTTLQMRLKG
jgi:DNA-binding response OmpR family regulator